MGAVISRGKTRKISAGRDSLMNTESLAGYDKDTLDAVKNIKDGPTTNIEITISCNNLPKFDWASETDPRVYCFIENNGKYMEVGKTEIISNDFNPKFKTKIKVPYNFEKNQIVKFEIFDIDEFKENEVDKKEFIGFVVVNLHDIVCANNQTITTEIIAEKTRNKKPATITLRGSEYDDSSSSVVFHIGARSFITKNELSLHVYLVEGQEMTTLATCDFMQNNKKGFDWPEFSVLSSSLPDDNCLLKFEVFERTKTKPKIHLGAAEMQLGILLGYTGRVIKLIKEGFTIGELKVKECKRITQYTFLNYIYGGAEVSLIIAMDFTNSNKDPTDKRSLHYIPKPKKTQRGGTLGRNESEEDYDENTEENEYLQALKSIGGILQHYDSDKKIPLLGFGAKLPPYHNYVSHCFSMNGNFFDPEVNGLEEVIETYKGAVHNFKFHGPTMFSEIFRMACEYAAYESSQDKQKYLILLVLTDGDISDMQATKDEIVKACDLPLSILIIGVGNDEFSQMKVLDGDVEPIVSSDGKLCTRDIVQFVPFSHYKNDFDALARETLAEIPQQFLEYMQMNGIEPNLNQEDNVIKNHENIISNLEARIKDGQITKKIPSFLRFLREDFTKKLLKLEMPPDLIQEVLNKGIPAPDVGLFIEMVSQMKAENPQTKNNLDSESSDDEKEKKPKMKVKKIAIGKERNIEAEKSKAKEHSYKITQELLEQRDKEILQRKVDALGVELFKKKDEKSAPKPISKIKKRKVFEEYQDHNEHFHTLTRDITPISVEDNICMKCRENSINTVFMPCGHASLCQSCLEPQNLEACVICKTKPEFYMSTTAKLF